MAETFNVGEKVRRVGAAEVGTVVAGALPGMVKVEYEHPGRVVVGVFCAHQVEKVADEAPSTNNQAPENTQAPSLNTENAEGAEGTERRKKK